MIPHHPPITDVVLDFDGTCTQIPTIAEQYLEMYRQGFVKSVGPLTKWNGRGRRVKFDRNHQPPRG